MPLQKSTIFSLTFNNAANDFTVIFLLMAERHFSLSPNYVKAHMLNRWLVESMKWSIRWGITLGWNAPLLKRGYNDFRISLTDCYLIQQIIDMCR